jgi:hypothetical protein
MKPEYTTVMDAGTPVFPAVPLIVVVAMPVLIFAFMHVAKGRNWRSSRPMKLGLWCLYLAYLPMVAVHYWTLWSDQSTARNATRMSVEAGPLDWPLVNRTPHGLFVDFNQGFTVNGVAFLYQHHSLRYLDFLLPSPELVALPLRMHAHVRITYRGDGDNRQLLKFEIATSDMDGAHD